MTEDRFKNRKEALLWLQNRGQISTGKFYQDCADGKISIAADKTLSKYQVMEYAEKVFGFVRQAAPSVDQEDKKRRLEIEKLEMEVEKARIANRKEDANWLQKEEAWAQMAAVIGTLRDSLRHQIHIGSVAIIHAAGGDPARGPEVYEQAEELISRAFNEVVNAGRIEGMFVKGQELD
jgi:hypothetical protein